MLVDAALINLLGVEKMSHVKKMHFVCYSEHMDKGTEVHTTVFLFCVVRVYFIYLTMLSAPRDT